MGVVSCPSDNELAALVDDRLGASTRAAVELHLDDCERCGDLVAELARGLLPERSSPPGYRLLRAREDETWEAEDPGGRRVVLGFGAACDPRLAVVRDPHVIEVVATGELDGEPFVATDELGPTARAWQAEATRSPDEVLAVWRQALAGLAALHRVSLVHGRVSPDHVEVGPTHVARVGGFTRPLVRTAGHVAPEVLTGGAPTAASDQFGACAALWEALAGRVPFEGATAGALRVAMQLPPAPPPGADRQIFAVLARGLAVDPTKRWPSVEALSAALAARRRASPWFAAAALAAMVVVVALLRC